MGSKKPSARARQREAFRAQGAELGDIFSREQARRDDLERRRDEARYEKACASKKRYPTRADALDAIAACAEHGRSGLSCYKCPYCGGWHLTSHPWTETGR